MKLIKESWSRNNSMHIEHKLKEFKKDLLHWNEKVYRNIYSNIKRLEQVT